MGNQENLKNTCFKKIVLKKSWKRIIKKKSIPTQMQVIQTILKKSQKESL